LRLSVERFAGKPQPERGSQFGERIGLRGKDSFDERVLIVNRKQQFRRQVRA